MAVFERRVLRSRMSLEEKMEKKKEEQEKILKEKEEFEKRPFITYKGKIKYVTDFQDCAMICDKLLEEAEKSEESYVVGFDLEWPFSFQTGPGKVAVIQISPSLEMCYVMHVSEMKKLPKSLSEFLQNPKVRIVGVNIKNDVRKLGRDFPGFNSDIMVENCIDVGVLAKTFFPSSQRWSMERLVSHMLKMKINKDKRVRMSKWHVIPLSRPQLKYAAIDAYASLLLYQQLETMKTDNEDKEQDQNAINN